MKDFQLTFTSLKECKLKLNELFTNNPQGGIRAHLLVEPTAGVSEAGNEIIATEDRIVIPANLNNIVWMYGHIHANATTGGTMKLQWAQGVSSATKTFLIAGSWVRITYLDN